MQCIHITAITLLLAILGAADAYYNLTVVHTNDVHAHFMQFNVYGGRCTSESAEKGECFGGFARQVAKVKEVRAKRPNVVFLDGGDYFQGTVWYTFYKWKALAEFVNQLTLDVMSLGNHEFDDGPDGLIPYLEALKPKVAVCNMNATLEPDLDRFLKKSVILEINGQKIGVIGYLTPKTPELSSPGNNLFFMDEVECIQAEARRLIEEEGINKIVALGHSGYAVDMTIAKIPEVDIVVGGHTHTFLYTGDAPSVEEPQGLYPTIVEHEDGTKALVVQDFAFGKYLGYLDVEFDDEGRIVAWSGNPILLDNSVEQDQHILEMLKPYAQELKRRGMQEVGHTNVLLRGDRTICRMEECNLGNYVADAFLHYFISDPTEKGWTDVAIAVCNSGAIRGSIDERINNGSITLEDILTVLPFSNTMEIVGLKGKHLKEVLEASVKEYDVEGINGNGGFLQVSGLKVTFDVSLPAGSRVVDVKARCTDCRVPRYLAVDDEAVYQVVMGSFVAKGGDGLSMIPKNAVSSRMTNEIDADILIEYLKKYSPVTIGLEGRITILGRDIVKARLNTTSTITTALADDAGKTPA